MLLFWFVSILVVVDALFVISSSPPLTYTLNFFCTGRTHVPLHFQQVGPFFVCSSFDQLVAKDTNNCHQVRDVLLHTQDMHAHNYMGFITILTLEHQMRGILALEGHNAALLPWLRAATIELHYDATSTL